MITAVARTHVSKGQVSKGSVDIDKKRSKKRFAYINQDESI